MKLVLILCLLLPATAVAQTKPKTMRIGEPSSVGVAMMGTVMVGAGVGVMLYQDACFEHCPSNAPYVMGGTVVVAAGVAMVYLGLRPKTVVIAPMLAPRLIGVAGRITWPKR